MWHVSAIALSSALMVNFAHARFLATQDASGPCGGRLDIPANPCGYQGAGPTTTSLPPDPCIMDCASTYIEHKTSDVIPMCWDRTKTFPPCAETWFVVFCDPDCECCKKFKPTWIDFAEKTMAAKVGAVDCRVNRHICEYYGVTGYPALEAFHHGEWSHGPQGGTGLHDIQDWARRVVSGGNKANVFSPGAIADFNKDAESFNSFMLHATGVNATQKAGIGCPCGN